MAAVQEAIRQSIFISHVEKNAPGTGETFGFLSDLTNGLKEQQQKAIANRNSGNDNENFMDMYAQVKDVAPELAAAGFAKASIGAEYLMKEAPAAINSILKVGGNVIDNIRGCAPEAVTAAEIIGNKMAAFVLTQEPALISAMESAGSNAFSFFKQYAPNDLQQAAKLAGIESAQLASIIAKELPSAIGTAQQIGGDVASSLPAVALQIKSVIGTVIQNAPGGLKVAAEQISSVAGAVPGALSSAAGVVSSALTSENVSAATNIALSVIGTAAAAFPFLLPLQIALKDIGHAVQHATYNRETAKILEKNCADCTKLVAEMAEKLDKLTNSEQERIATLEPLVLAIKDCTEFITQFTKKGFISVMISWKNDDRAISNLEKKVSNALQNLSIRVNGHQIDRQVEDSEKLDKMMNLLDKIPFEKLNAPTTIDPEILASVAREAGCRTAEHISYELQGLGFELKQIEKAVEQVTKQIDNIDRKLDTLSSTILHSMEDQSAKTDALKSLILQSQADMRKAQQQSLQEMMQKLQTGQTEITKIFSNKIETENLARRAVEIATSGVGLIIVHSHGVGELTRVNINGRNGKNGDSPPPGSNGSHGRNGTQYALDGQDGDDGADGRNGGEGTDGYDGTDAEDFEVFFEYVSEDIAKGTRKYKIEHKGVRGIAEHFVEINIQKQVFLVFGKGGNGGAGGHGGHGARGGNGGNGGSGVHGVGPHNPDGGSGGNGGSGGDGGVGGLGGAGGQGANGATVIVHTNDPTVFSLMYIDVSKGDGGKAGKHGTSGEPGLPGSGGGSGLAHVWTVSMPSQNGTTYREERGRPGRAGKQGKKGKAGNAPTARASKDGKDGTSGKVSICVYDESGMETGGTPYRIALNKSELQKVKPLSVIYNTLSKNDPFIFGEKLEYGPTLPVNLGTIYAPDSKMVGSLFFNFSLQKVAKTDVPFPKIPGRKGTKNGELSASNAQKIELKIPGLKNSGFYIDENFWPWPVAPSLVPSAKATFKIEFAVDGISMRASKEDGENAQGVIEYPVTVDIPTEVVVASGTNAIRCPISVAISSGPTSSEITATFTVRNKLRSSKLKNGDNTYTIRIASFGFRPEITATLAEVRALSTVSGEHGFMKIKSTGFIDELQPGQSQDVSIKFRLPKNDNANHVEPGAQILVRAELLHQGYMAYFTAPSIIRVAPPLPPTSGGSPLDVLVFCNYSLVVEDYRAIQKMYSIIGLQVHFLDCDHFLDRSLGRIPRALWQNQFGKSVVVWLPPTPAEAKLISDEDLFGHLRGGGGLVYGAAATFQWMDPNMSRSPPARCAIKLESPEGSLNALRTGATLQQNKLGGKSMLMLAAATISAMPSELRLRYLTEKHNEISNIQIGEMQLTAYSSQIDSGCCGGGKMKVMPLSKTPCLLIDLVVAAIRTDISVDLKNFSTSLSFQNCSAVSSIVSWHHVKLGGHKPDLASAMLAREVLAAATAAKLTNERVLTGKPGTAWKKHNSSVLAALNSCAAICDSHNLDYRVVSRRAEDIDIISGFSVVKNAINFSDNKIVFGVKV